MDLFEPEKVLARIKKNKPMDLSLDDPFTNVQCKQCLDRGIYMENGFAVPCHCVKQRALQRKFASCQIPESMLNNTFEKFNFDYYPKDKSPSEFADLNTSYHIIALKSYDRAKRFAESYVKEKAKQGLYIYGPVGSGKTFLACCIANYILKKSDKELLFIIIPEFLQRLKSTYNKNNAESEYGLIERASNVPLLFMDDLGAHNYTDWTINIIYNIINYRVNHSLPVVITSNLSIDINLDDEKDTSELGRLLNKRIASRIGELCMPLYLGSFGDIRYKLLQKRKEAMMQNEQKRLGKL